MQVLRTSSFALLVTSMLSACATTGTDELLTPRRQLAATRANLEPARTETPSEDLHREPELSLAEKAEALVATMRDDIDCTRAVARTNNGRGEAAWQIILACARQGKWRNLQRLLEPPLIARVRALSHDEQILLVASVIANRGGLFEADLPLVQRAHIDVSSLNEAFARQLPPGSWVIFRATVERERRDKRGVRLAKLSELGRNTQDRKGRIDVWDSWGRTLVRSEITKVGSQDSYEETGTVVEAIMPESAPFLGSGQFIFLGRISSMHEEELGQRQAKVQVVQALPPGAIMFDVTR